MSSIKFFFKACNVLSDPFTNWVSSKNVCIERDIVYDTTNPNILRADLYYTKLFKESKYPIFINVHGGGFVGGDKKYRRGFSLTMAREGYFVMNINYGLCPSYKFPYFIQNVISAINWSIDNSDKYNLDTNKIILCGDSSGSFIAAVTAAAIYNPAFCEEIKVNYPNIKLRALMLYCGIYDFLSVCDNNDYIKKNINYPEIITGMNREKLVDLGFYDIIKPSNYVNENYPPTFITYSTKDILCNGTSDTLIDSLIEHKVPHKIFKATNVSDIHCFHLRPIIKNAKLCLKESNSFIIEKLVLTTEKQGDYINI